MFKSSEVDVQLLCDYECVTHKATKLARKAAPTKLDMYNIFIWASCTSYIIPHNGVLKKSRECHLSNKVAYEICTNG
jgi:hypothetical protein